jgi:hypothetical protein
VSLSSPLQVAALVSLTALAFAALVGLIAVFDEGGAAGAVGEGVGIAFSAFAAGATIVCGLACIGRRKIELPALAAVALAGVALDLLVLAIWLDIRSEAYEEIVGVGFAWTLLALVMLGLTLALETPTGLSRVLYLATLASAVITGLISTWLIFGSDGGLADPLAGVGDGGLLRALGATLVLMSTLWVASLAASRLESPRR